MWDLDQNLYFRTDVKNMAKFAHLSRLYSFVTMTYPRINSILLQNAFLKPLNCYILCPRMHRSQQALKMSRQQMPNLRREIGLGKRRRRSQLWSPSAEKTTSECKGFWLQFFKGFLFLIYHIFWGKWLVSFDLIRNPGFKTIEEELMKAFRDSGTIPDEWFDNMQLSFFQVISYSLFNNSSLKLSPNVTRGGGQYLIFTRNQSSDPFLRMFENVKNVQLFSFQRASRTDKGVSAAKMIISLKLRKLNKMLQHFHFCQSHRSELQDIVHLVWPNFSLRRFF